MRACLHVKLFVYRIGVTVILLLLAELEKVAVGFERIILLLLYRMRFRQT